jgi:hypothetical protein
MKYPKELPVCEHVTWGLVTIVDPIPILDKSRSLKTYIAIYPDRLHELQWNIAQYLDRAYVGHLRPLTPAAREMLAECKKQIK